jgi:hypothetical protein
MLALKKEIEEVGFVVFYFPTLLVGEVRACTERSRMCESESGTKSKYDLSSVSPLRLRRGDIKKGVRLALGMNYSMSLSRRDRTCKVETLYPSLKSLPQGER